MSNKFKQGTMRRRDFLKRAVGAGVAAAAAGPWIWVPRRGLAQATDFHGAARHVMVLWADGGLRSHSIFNADLSLEWNPHLDAEGRSTQPGAPGTQWAVGGVLDKAPIALPSWGQGQALPPLAAVSNKINVLATVDHLPNEVAGDVNHRTARQRMTTGFFDGRTGLLAQVYKHHPNYAGDLRFTAFPPVVIGGPARLFGEASGEDAPHRAIFFNGPEDFRRQGIRGFQVPTPDWTATLGQRLDERFTAGMGPENLARVGLYLDSKRNMGRFRDILALPSLNLLEDQDTDADPRQATNAMLREAFGAGPWGPRMALAVRMLQLGSPMIAVGVSGYDTHSNEVTDFPPLARDLGRQLSALAYVLPRLPHPEGGTYWDHTLITVVSEFSRDNTERLTGYNSAQGSDHQGEFGSRFQAIPFMGGAIDGGLLVNGTDPATMAPDHRELIFPTQGILATLADAVGVDTGLFFPTRPVTAMFTG